MDEITSADDILFVLNGLRRPDISDWRFCVIVGGRDEIPGQGRAAGRMVRLPKPTCDPFELGEVLVVDGEYGREPFGEGRKPAKWDVDDEYFDTLAEALARRDEVLSEAGTSMTGPPDAPVEWTVTDMTTGESWTEVSQGSVSPEEFVTGVGEVPQEPGYHVYCSSCRAGCTYPCPVCPQGHCSIAWHRTRLSRRDDRERRR